MKSARPWRYSSALAVDASCFIVADADKQHFTVIPETVYYSMQLRCERYGGEFWFTAHEQRTWDEDWEFWIDPMPRQCAECRQQRREQNGRA